LGQFARTLVQIAGEIPNDIDWVLRVDGHTDRQPINTAAFPSNWELSTARAVSVVKFLIEQGIPPNRVAATGFGEYQPLEAGGDELPCRRDRRIEFKLTERCTALPPRHPRRRRFAQRRGLVELQRREVRVEAAGGDQLAVPAALDQAALVDDEDA